MNFDFVRDSKYIYHMRADNVVVGEIRFENSRWFFHYHANWPTLTRDEEIAVWKLINDQKNLLNVTVRLKGHA